MLDNPWLTGEVASTQCIGSTIKALRLFNARNKFKATIKAIIATKHLEALLQGIRAERIGLDLVGFGISVESVMKASSLFNDYIRREISHDIDRSKAVLIPKKDFVEIFQKCIGLPDGIVFEELYDTFHKENSIDPRVVSIYGYGYS